MARFLAGLRAEDVDEIPDHMACMRLIFQGWRQIATLDEIKNGDQPVRAELTDREGNVIAVAE